MSTSSPGIPDDPLAGTGQLVAGGVYVGRIHLPPASCHAGVGGPTPVAIRPDGLFDLTPYAPTMAQFLDLPDAADIAASADLRWVGALDEALLESHHARRGQTSVHLLAPLDLQVIKACGVTFAPSLVERIIEEQAAGRPDRVTLARTALREATGGRMDAFRAGTEQAAELHRELRAIGMDSTYLEVGLGPYAEVFTKAPVLSAVGTGQQVQIRADSSWNNPEPEVVLAVNRFGRIAGAGLGNDVNLRDLEGRSPLLLGIAKDNNASCAVGPWLRLFDDQFTLKGLMETDVTMVIDGQDGFHSHGQSRLAEISRDPLDLVEQASGAHHQYPDGFALFLGTMLVPDEDRAGDGQGFTHHRGDRVSIGNPSIGTLINWVGSTGDAPPWVDGLGWLFDNLARRGLVGAARRMLPDPVRDGS